MSTPFSFISPSCNHNAHRLHTGQAAHTGATTAIGWKRKGGVEKHRGLDEPDAYARSPRIRRASWMSLGMMVTRLAWMAHRLVSSKRPTRYASEASWSATTADDWKRRSVLKSCAISRTRRWKGSLRMSSSVDFW